MNKKITFLIVILAVIVLSIVVWNYWGKKSDLPLVEKRLITIAEGSFTSSCYPVTKAVTEIWNKYSPDVLATPELDPGRLSDSLKNIEEGKYNFRWTMSSLAFYSYNGIKIEELIGNPMKSLRTVGAFFGQDILIVAKEDSLINDIADLKGEKVKVIVALEKKWVAITVKELLAIYGIPPSQVEIVFVPLLEIAESLKTGGADIGVVATPAESKQASMFKKATGLKFLSLSQDIIQKAQEQYSYYIEGIVPKNTYSGQPDDIEIIVIKGIMVCSKDMDSDLVYNLTKTIFDHLDEIKGITPLLKDLSLQGAVEGVSIPLHPGAERYYSELGLIP